MCPLPCSSPPTVYCALCAIPCLTPPITPLRSSLFTSPPLPDITGPDEWLSDLSALRLTSTPTPDPNSTSPPTQTVHQITLHSYCLSSAIRIATPPSSPTLGAEGFGKKVQIWNLPKFSGMFDWDDLPVPEDVDDIVDGEDDEMIGVPESVEGKDVRGLDGKSWAGLETQLERWKAGLRHYLDADLVSPIILPSPSTTPPSKTSRPIEANRLSSLPPHIFLQITSYLLDPPPSTSSPKPQLLKQTRHPHPDFFALLQTSSTFRDFAFPHSFWADLVKGQTHQYTLDLLTRWKSSPIKEISTERLDSILKSEFGDPVEAALDVALAKNAGRSALTSASVSSEIDGKGYTARDVFVWWLYSSSWRSRRRVWRSIVFGCARARDSDAEQ